MPITFLCPTCGQQHNAPDSAAGKQAKCKCGTVLAIPGGPSTPLPQPPAAPLPVQGAQPTQGYSVGAAPVYSPAPGYPAVSGLGPARRTGTAENDLRMLVSLMAMGVGAYSGYFYGRLLYHLTGQSFSMDILRAIALFLAYMPLIAAGVMIISRARPAAIFTLVVGIILASLVGLNSLLSFIDIIRLAGDRFGQGGGYGIGLETKLELVFNLFIRTLVQAAPPAVFIWWASRYR